MINSEKIKEDNLKIGKILSGIFYNNCKKVVIRLENDVVIYNLEENISESIKSYNNNNKDNNNNNNNNDNDNKDSNNDNESEE